MGKKVYASTEGVGLQEEMLLLAVSLQEGMKGNF